MLDASQIHLFHPTLGILSHPVRGWWRGIQSPPKCSHSQFRWARIPIGHLPFFSSSKSRFSSTGCLRSITMPRLSFEEATVLPGDDHVASFLVKKWRGKYLSFNNSCTWQFFATFFRVVKWTFIYLHGCWWPPNRESKGHESIESPGMDFFICGEQTNHQFCNWTRTQAK